jgi:hypothetical protein
LYFARTTSAPIAISNLGYSPSSDDPSSDE